MSGFSLGWTNPTDPTTSESWNFGFNAGSAHGGGSSQSASDSVSYDYGTGVWGGQGKYLKDLYKRAAGQSSDDSNQQLATRMLQEGMSGIRNFMNPQNNPMFQAYSRQIGEQFREQILPGIRQQSAGINQYGGSRQAISEGLAAQRAQANLQDFGAQLYNADRDRALSALKGIPGMAQMALGIPWYNLNSYGGLLGGPVMVDKGGFSSSTSRSSSEHSNESSNFGYSIGGSESSGGGGGGGFNFGIG